ncbi:MAG: CBS domain-containing protein [Bacillota bacterium]|nr:CBS domain-containing protein [Bacillota bacterium]
MKIIIGHPNLDFDALASMVAAKKLYPDAVMVTVGKADHNVMDFMNLHSETIEIQNYINKKDVDTLIMVDTRSSKRLQEFAVVLKNIDLKVIIYDHHMPSDYEIDGAELHYEALGANVTQMVELIQEREIEITPQEATVFALGIYEDTGSLSYTSTTVRDIKAAAWVLDNGANLGVVRNYINRAFTPEQQDLLNVLMANCHVEKIRGKKILFSQGETAQFVGELASLTGKLRDFHIVDAVFTVVRMGNRIYIVSRSSSEQINVREVLKFYGGMGHDHACSATIRDADSISIDAVIDKIRSELLESIAPPLMVKDIMTTPVKTIDAHTTIQEVEEYLIRYGHSGYPVMEEGKLIGIISRRDVEKAIYHGFGKVPVKGYMSHHVMTISEDIPVEEARTMMLEQNVGRFPVVRGEELVGIISRTDLLQLLYGEKVTTRHKTTYEPSEIAVDTSNMLLKLKNSLPENTYRILGEIASLADREGYRVFLVGGLVRDMMLETSSSDLDIVVEGDGITFARLVSEQYHGHLTAYEKFGTSNVMIEGFLKLDIASARTEFYEYPAALPQVENSTLRQDLYRRDFTINAMAISLNFSTIGQLVDYYNGREDLLNKRIRVLHNLSFVEDPTRIMRAIRFAIRYGFQLEEETEMFAKKAIADGVFEKLSYRRIWQEVMISLKEDDPYTILEQFNEFGLWDYIFPGHPFDSSLKSTSEFLENHVSFLKYLKTKPSVPLIYFLLLVYDMTRDELDEFFKKIEGRRHYKDSAYYVNRAKGYFFDEVPTLDIVDWYKTFSEQNPEIMIVLMLKADKNQRKIINNAAMRYFRYQLKTNRHDLKELVGKKRKILQEIIEDLIREKTSGRLSTKEEELDYVRSNLKIGKYHDDDDAATKGEWNAEP